MKIFSHASLIAPFMTESLGSSLQLFYTSQIEDFKESWITECYSTLILTEKINEAAVKKIYAQYGNIGLLKFIANPDKKTWEIWWNPVTINRLRALTKIGIRGAVEIQNQVRTAVTTVTKPKPPKPSWWTGTIIW